MTDYPNNTLAKLEIIKESEITPKEVRWLWYPYIPFGKAHAGGACKGSDCKRSNGFAGSRCCLIDFTHNYTLWRLFKKYLKTT